MKITTLMDDQPSSSFKNEHGLSFYIQAHNTNILFDTGASSLYLENARKLSLPIEEVDTLIISHGHYDHTGGLSDFLKINKNAKIYMQKDALLPHYHDEKYIGIDFPLIKFGYFEYIYFPNPLYIFFQSYPIHRMECMKEKIIILILFFMNNH